MLDKLNIVARAIEWIENLFHKEYGIRTLYLLLFLIPSICLGSLYFIEARRNDELILKLEKSQKDVIDCLEKRADIKNEVRSEVLNEFKEAYETIKKFEIEVLLENQKTVEEIEKLEELKYKRRKKYE